MARWSRHLVGSLGAEALRESWAASGGVAVAALAHRPELEARMLGIDAPGAPRIVASFTVRGGRIASIDLIADPAKTARVPD